MRALEHLGMVSSERRVGLTVLPMEKWAVYDPAIIGWRLDNDKTRGQQVARLNELRLGIEPVAARLAAGNATAQQRAELLRLAARLAELESTPSPRVGEELETDLRFHTLILRASGNEMLAALALPSGDAQGQVRLRLPQTRPHQRHHTAAHGTGPRHRCRACRRRRRNLPHHSRPH